MRMAEDKVDKVGLCNKCGENKKIAIAFDGFQSCRDCALDIYKCDLCEEMIEIDVYKKHLMESHTREMLADKLAGYKLAGYGL